MWNILLCCRPLPPLVPFRLSSIVLYFIFVILLLTIKGRYSIAIAYLLLDCINETSQTTHPGPSYLTLRAGYGNCLTFIHSIVDKVVFNE